MAGRGIGATRTEAFAWLRLEILKAAQTVYITFQKGGGILKEEKMDRCRVWHRVLLHSERIVLLRSFKARNVLLLSFFEFLATYET